MPKLIIKHDQACITPDEIYDVRNGELPVDLLMRYIPDGIDPDYTKVFLNLTELDIHDSREMLQPLMGDQILTVAHEVKGIESALLIGSIVLSIAVYASMPDIPGDVGISKSSPNNSHTGQTNLARAYQALPMIFGSPESWPDLMGQPIVEFIDNVKNITQYMCVTYGEVDDVEVRIGSTPFANYDDAEYEFFEPSGGTTIIADYDTVVKVDEIEGQELLGRNQGVDGDTYELDEAGIGTVIYVGSTWEFRVAKSTSSDALKYDFDNYVSADYYVKLEYNRDLGVGTGEGKLQSMVLDGTGSYYTTIITSFDGPTGGSYSGPYVLTNILSSVIGPFNLQKECSKFQSNITFPNGLKGTVNYRIIFQKLDGKNGTVLDGFDVVEVESITDTTLEYRAYTIYTTLPTGWYRVSYERINDSNDDAANPDQTFVDGAYIVEENGSHEFPNVTILKSVIPARSNTTASDNSNKINLSLTSKLITYSGGSINYTASASRKAADALLHLYVEVFGRDPDSLDLDELYEIQNRLDLIDPRLATFDFTFDDLDVSLDDMMDTILQVMRCYKWLDGNVYRFARDEKRDFESAIITRRDIVAESDRSYSYNYNPSLESYDSVKLEYIDSETNSKAYIYRKLDGSGDVIDGVGLNPISMELAGCREEYNAINRAELEMRKLMYQRSKLSDTLLPSGMFLDKGDMFLYAEQYNKSDNLFDGEILEVSGTVATTSEQVFFDGVSSYVVHYTDENGDSFGPYPITEVSGNANKFNCSSLADAYVRDSKLGYLVQTGSRYIISTVEELSQSRWSLVEKEPSGRNVQVTAVNYDERVYEYDEE